MDKSLIFSIIVPFYNAESYIEQCAESLFDQTLSDKIEWIFVSDGSTDSSLERLNALIDSKVDIDRSRVHVISFKCNRGTTEARRIGVEMSKSPYIMFCDADDWFELNACEILYKELMQEEVDVIVFDYINEYKLYSCPAREDVNAESMLKDLVSGKVSCSLWNRVIKADLLKDGNLRNPVGSMIEDLIICIQVMHSAASVKVISDLLYHYRHNNLSITKNSEEAKVLERFETNLKNSELLYEILRNWRKDEEYRDEIIIRKFMAKQILNPCLDNSAIRRMWLSTYPEINGLILKSKLFPLKQKLLYIMVKIRLQSIFLILKSIKARIRLS